MATSCSGTWELVSAAAIFLLAQLWCAWQWMLRLIDVVMQILENRQFQVSCCYSPY